MRDSCSREVDDKRSAAAVWSTEPGLRADGRGAHLGHARGGLFRLPVRAIEPGFAEIVQPYREELSHREGFFQGADDAALANFAAGASAGSLLPHGWENATADYTVKIVAPGVDEGLVERGRVVKPGHTLTVVNVEVHAAGAGRAILRASALVTFRNLSPSIIR